MNDLRNEIIGKKLEERVCNMAYDKGWFAYNIPNQFGGQPFDIVLAKGKGDNQVALFLDAKNITNGDFYYSRIEPNQFASMIFLNEVGFKNVGFVLYFKKHDSYKMLFFKDIDYINEKKISYNDNRLVDFYSVI